MNEEEKLQKDILLQIDMQLYDEFNDKFCEMNDNLGTIYTYKDIDDLEKLEKETEIKLLRKVIEKQQKEIEDLKNDHIDFWINTKEVEDMVRGKFINKDKIKEKIEELEEAYEEDYIIKIMQSLL